MSARLSYLTRMRRNWFNQANVRSTTHRQWPSPLPMSRAAHGEQRENTASSEALTYGLCVIRTVAEEAVRTAPRPASLALERRNRIDEPQRFLRIMPVGTGQTDRERNAPGVADHMAFAPSLGSVGGIRTRLASTTHRPHGAAIDNRPRPVNLVVTREPIEQDRKSVV